MASLTKRPLKQVPIDDLGGGLNEIGNVVPIRECSICENFRASEDGLTKKKRKGLSKIDSTYDFGTKKVFGIYGIEEEEGVDITAFLENEIKLKSGNDWNSIFNPTKQIDKPVSVAQDKGLVFVAGYEKLITLKKGQANYSGIEAPVSAPTVEAIGAPTDYKVAEYLESNQDRCGKLRSNAEQTLLSQSFKLEFDYELNRINLKLRKIGSPTGNLWAEIHQTRSATSTTKNASPGIVGQGTGNLDVSTIKTSFLKVTDTTIAFVSETKKITDTNNGLAGFLTGEKIKVTGSAENDGTYTIATGGVEGEIVVSEDLVDEDAGASITIDTVYELTFSGTKPDLSKEETYYLVVYGDFTVDAGDFIEVGFDCSSPDYPGGKYFEIEETNGSLSWKSYGTVDLVFELYGKKLEDMSLLKCGVLETDMPIPLRFGIDPELYLLSQSFKASEGMELSKIKLSLAKVGFPSDYVWVEIHSSQAGTSEDKGDSDNIVGQPSDDVQCGDIPDDYTWVEFTFSGTKPSLTKDATYYIVLYTIYEVIYPHYINWIINYPVPLMDDAQGYYLDSSLTWHIIGGGNYDFSFELIGIGTSELKAQEYPFKNLDDIKELREADEATLLAQEFQVFEVSDVTKVKVFVSKVGSPTGNIWAEIHRSQGGTSTDKDLSDAIVGKASDDVDVSTLSAFPDYGADKVTDTSIAFVSAEKKITDTNNGLAGFLTGDKIKVTGSASNDGTYIVATGGVAGEIVVEEDLVEEEAGESVSIEKIWVTFTFSVEKPRLDPDTIYYLVIYGDFDISPTDYVRLGMDKINPQYSLGKRWDIDEELEWTEKDSIDLIFEIYMSTSDVVGDYSFVVTFIRGGDYQCESNPSPPSEKITLASGSIFRLTNIPVSDDPEVTDKGIYRTKAGGEKRYWEVTIENDVTEHDTGATDDGLGDEVSFDNNPPPLGDSIEIWDDQLWVSGVPGFIEGLFRSRRGYLEQFPDTAISYIPLREDQSDRVVRAIEFDNYLYPFKTSSIWVISRSGTSYVIDKIVNGTGTVAGASIVECNMKEGRALVFLSNHYRIEIMDRLGRLIAPELSAKVKRTLKSINKEYAHRSTAQSYDGHEYRLSIPTGSSNVPNKVIVFDYLKRNFYVDTHYQNMCSLSTTNLASGRRETIFGTDSGEALKIDEDATTDDGHIIDAKFRTGWMGGSLWKRLRKIWLDYVLPADKNLLFKVYSNFRETPDLSIFLPGSTPSGIDAELRNIIHRKLKTAVNGDYFSFYFANSEDVGGDLRINKIWLYIQIEKSKRTVKAS